MSALSPLRDNQSPCCASHASRTCAQWHLGFSRPSRACTPPMYTISLSACLHPLSLACHHMYTLLLSLVLVRPTARVLPLQDPQN
ncbi:hypothetical protein DENSPDRAFT_455837 [Dentipellis sp. KUC8613]|nr:hypothetical protein DENSPDRAFT_455837 [Dentipellis sp. KUC8613]